MTKPKANATAFSKGRPKTGGRQIGSVNKIPLKIKKSIIQAAEEYGSDGKGKDGAVGVFKLMIKNELPAFAMLISRMLPTQLNADVNHRDEGVKTRADAIRRLKQLSLPIDRIFDLGRTPTLELEATEETQANDGGQCDPQDKLEK